MTTTEPPKRMMRVTKDPVSGKYLVEINFSSLDIIQTCPKKAYYALHRGLIPKEGSMATTFGKGIHKALEIMYAYPREARTLPSNYKSKILMMCQGQTLDDEQSSFVYQATRGFIDETASLASLPIEDKRSLVNGGWLLGEYFESRWNDPYEVLFIDGKPQVESLLETDIYEDSKMKIRFFGTVDAIFENKSTGQLVVCDHKTTSAMYIGQFLDRTKPNHQYTAYIHLAQQCLGLNTENFMINVFQVKPKPKTSRGKGPDFLHVITKRTPEDIEDMIQSTAYYVSQYIHWLEDGYWPFGTVNSCGNYGKCTYLDVCASPNAIKESILDANFIKRGNPDA